MRMMHCGQWQRATESYVLLPDKKCGLSNNQSQQSQIIQILTCLHCDKTMYQVYSVLKNSQKTQPLRVSKKLFDTVWQPKILTKQLNLTPKLGFGLYSSMFSHQVSRPADQALLYWKRSGSAV